MLSKIARENRRNLCEKLANGLIFSAGNNYVRRNSDVDYPFRQDSNFLYLTGIEAPGYAFILIPKTNEYLLFIPKINTHHRVWIGNIPDLAESKKIYGADKIFYFDEYEKQLHLLSKKFDKTFSPQSPEFLSALSELRFVKSKEELKLMKEAARISSKAHLVARKYARPGLFEYQVQAQLEKVMLEEGARLLAYPSIVGTGKNSAVLHYHANSSKLQKGELLLIDAGAEVHGYASDITRTFPVSGQWTTKQKDIYDVVQNAQKKSISSVRSGVKFRDVHKISALTILEGLTSLGLLKGRSDELLERGVDRLFYPHGIGHALGLDVHDVVPLPKNSESHKIKKPGSLLRLDRALVENAVVTVEPGIYFIPALLQDPSKRKKYQDCVQWNKVDKYLNFGGIRIEDDVIVTKAGSDVYTL
ncbi:MAG: aminopeptidase P family protein [Deltaproteobacteria bacterium]|nr:aminopeptidase P family protein [Deltaproteobacteria bacterium]